MPKPESTLWTHKSRDLNLEILLWQSLFVGCLMSQQHASVSQSPICSDKCMCCHTEIEVADQTFYLTHNILTPVQPVPALTIECQEPGRAAIGVPIFKLLVCLNLEKPQRKRESNSGSATLEVDAFDHQVNKAVL